eukprot:3210229-Pyramimonas_sp.AAC.1
MFYGVFGLALLSVVHVAALHQVRHLAPRWRVPALLVFPNMEVVAAAVMLPGVLYSAAKLTARPFCAGERRAEVAMPKSEIRTFVLSSHV